MFKIKVEKAPTLFLECDSWSNVRNEGIINVILKTPEPVFYKSIEVGSNIEDADYLATKMKQVINEIGSKTYDFCFYGQCSGQ